jgi:outer membrane translocation and assembly module TamA
MRQPDLLVGTATVNYEDAAPPGRPQAGGRYEASLSRYWGRGTSTDDFVRFDLDLRHYLAVVTEGHVVALRAAASMTGALGQAQVPFYYLPRLGGGNSLRAVQHFRFYDRNSVLFQAEYRWLLHRFVETALFYDTGTVVPRLTTLAGGRMFSDVGVGVRFGIDSNAFVRIEAAFGNNDTSRVFVKFSGEF